MYPDKLFKLRELLHRYDMEHELENWHESNDEGEPDA